MLVSLFLFTLAVIEPAPPTTPAAGEPAAERPLQPGERKVKVVCRTQTKAGSRFTKRQCTEVNADARQTEEDQRAFSEIQSRPFINPPCQVSGRTC